MPIKTLLALLLLLPLTASAGIYTWTDDAGNVHFGDRPPIDSESETVMIRVNTYQAASDIRKTDARAADEDRVVLYSTKRCGYCKQARRFLNSKNIGYTEYDVETSAKGKRDFKTLNGRGVPIILVGDQRMNGYSEGRLVHMLEQAGYTPKR